MGSWWGELVRRCERSAAILAVRSKGQFCINQLKSLRLNWRTVMQTKVLTAHVPLPLAQKIDNLAAQLD
jgi:hypothetical protein